MSERTPLVEVLMRQREAWGKGTHLRVEELLDLYPQLCTDPEAILDLIYNETVLREEAGEQVQLDDYLQRFPHLESALRVQFEVEDALTMRDLATPVGSTSPWQPPTATPPRMPQLEGCELHGELGRGAMGVVYRGWQAAAQRPVAVKLLSSDVPAGRVKTEVQAASRLQHPNIVQVFEVKEFEGRTALVLEYVEGGNLAQKLAGKPHPPQAVARLVETLAWAMAYAHGRGVIHRDLKPSNVLLSAGPDEPLTVCIPKIGDFGLAKLVENSQRLTATSDILGTPNYMAPEQTGHPANAIGPATDVYALGAILYECLTGRPPFLGQSVLDTLDQVRQQEPVPPSRLQPRIPHDLEIICLKCLHKQPARRYASARELAEDLGRFQAGLPIHARPVSVVERIWKWMRRRPAIAAMLLVGLVVSGGLLAAGVVVNRVLRQQRDLALRQADDLDSQLARTRQLLYTAQLLRVGTVWESDPGQALRMLEDPNTCPPDLRCFSWGVLHAQCKRYRVSIAFPAPMTVLACHPKAKQIAIGFADGTIKIRDSTTGAETAALSAVGSAVTALAYAEDGQTIACGTVNGRVYLVDLSAQQSRRQIERRGERVSGLAWMPDQASLIVASGTDAVGQISVWDVPTLQQQRTIKGDTHPRTPVAVSSDGRFIAFSDRKHAIRLVDARTGADTRQLRGHTAPVTALVFASGGRSLLSGGLDSAVRLWDIRRDPREAETGHFTVATGPVTGLALHPNGQVLAVTGAGPLTSEGVAVANVQLWDLVSRRGGEPLRGHPGGAVGVAFTSDGGTLISIGNDRSLKLWDHPGRLEQATLRGHTGTAGTVALSGHGRTLAWIARGEGLGGRGQEINVMDLVAGTLINVFRGHGRPIQALAISGDGRQLAAAAGHLDEPAELLVWEVRTGRLLQAMTGHTNEVVAVAFSPAGNSLASASRDGAIKTWDLSTGKTRMQIAAQIQSVNVLVWSGDGGSLALCAGTAQGGTLLVLDATSGNLRAQGNTTESPTCLALAKDGSWAAYAGGGGQVHLVDVETGKERDPLVIGMKGISYLAISPDGQTLAVAGTAPSVKLWDVPTAQERASLPRHRGGACFVGFADDSRQLVSVSVTQTARVWNSATTR